VKLLRQISGFVAKASISVAMPFQLTRYSAAFVWVKGFLLEAIAISSSVVMHHAL